MADAHAKQHDYHLVNPSIWPLIGAISAFFMAVGGIMWMKGLAPVGGLKLGPFVFGMGVIGVGYTMVSWWTDVVKEAHGGDHTRVVQLHHRYGMIMFIASEVMFFVAWFWAYFDASLFAGEAIQEARVKATGGHWPPTGIQTFNPWDLPFVNTVILLLSGTTVTWAHHALLNNDRKNLIMGLWLTVILGVLFTLCQAYEYGHAAFKFGHANDISLAEPKPYIYGATFFMATGFHGAHVIIGTIFLSVCLYRAYLGHFSPKQHLGFEFAAWYWHFVDVVWLFLFACIYVWGAGAPGAH